jgi:hypothetical protein
MIDEVLARVVCLAVAPVVLVDEANVVVPIDQRGHHRFA